MCSSILESACGCLQESLLGFDWACIESVNQCGEICHLNNIEPSGPGTWYVSSFVWVCFGFFHHPLVVFGMQVPCIFWWIYT